MRMIAGAIVILSGSILWAIGTDSVERLQHGPVNVGWVSLVVGAALGALGLWLLLTRPTAEKERK
jgi:threonine/homoserine/homoserine lactone efflux protein